MAVEVDKSLLNFPFLTDDSTIKHVGESKVMFIMRGLPGSGKSTIMKLIAEKYKTTVTVCSADDYFLQEDGTYLYDKEKLSEAHDECQRKSKEACEAGTHVIVIDNTNVRQWEMSYYTNLASKHSYVTVLVTPKTPWRFNAEELAKRNKHSVPVYQLERKIRSYDKIVPFYFGWFLNDVGSRSLMEKVETYFKQCQQTFPEFASLIRENAAGLAVGEIELNSYYSREASSSETLHCTAFFSNRGRTESSSLYTSQDVVKRSLGKAYTLSVVGFVITPRTVGARIALTPRQARLWGKDDFEGTKSKADGFTIVTDSPKYRRRTKGNAEVKELQATSSPKSDGITGNHSDSDPGSYSPDDEDYEEMLAFEMAYVQLNERPRFMPTCGLGSRAHITLGYSRGSTAVQTGLDQVKIIDIEKGYHDNRAAKRPRHIELDDAAVIYYGEGQCVVYLNDPVDVTSLFSARY